MGLPLAQQLSFHQPPCAESTEAGQPTDVMRSLVGDALMASVFVPTSWRWNDHVIFMVDVTRILTEGRQRGAAKFYIAGDLTIQTALTGMRDRIREQDDGSPGP